MHCACKLWEQNQQGNVFIPCIFLLYQNVFFFNQITWCGSYTNIDKTSGKLPECSPLPLWHTNVADIMTCSTVKTVSKSYYVKALEFFYDPLWMRADMISYHKSFQLISKNRNYLPSTTYLILSPCASFLPVGTPKRVSSSWVFWPVQGRTHIVVVDSPWPAIHSSVSLFL